MPRSRKNQVNPVTEMPVIETPSDEFPIQHKPGSHGGIFDGIADRTRSNVVPINPSSEPVGTVQDWSAIDSVLSDVVRFD